MQRFFKKYLRHTITLALILLVAVSHFSPIMNVIALSYGEGENSLKVGVNNPNGFNVTSVKVNGNNWSNENDEYHTNDNQYTVVIVVDKKGEAAPDIQYGGNWNSYATKNYTVEGNTYTYTLNINDSAHQSFLGLEVITKTDGPGPGEEPNFDGKAYLVWSCGTGICYHYFDNIPSFDNGGSTFYKDTTITADNKEGISFDVDATYKGWYLKKTFDEWKDLYVIATGQELNWNTLDPELILGDPNQHIPELENAAINAKFCTRPAEDAPRKEHEDFESCIHLYAAQHDHDIWTHKLQPVGEPSYPNSYVSYGDRNFKVVIYNENYKGVTMGNLAKLHYYPAEWTNPYIRRDQFDISDTTKDKPAQLNSILLESTVIIKALNYNSFAIDKIEALDVPEDAVTITKDGDEFDIEFSSNFYDNVVFKVTDTNNKVSYIQIKRFTIDGWIGFKDNHPTLIADFYFDNQKEYKDFDLTAKILYKDGSTKNVTLTASYGIDDGLGNITWEYEVDEEHPEFGEGGKGLKHSTFVYTLNDGEDHEIKDVYLNAEYKGSTDSNYAGAYVGSGQGTLANIYHGEEE